jgi:energy-coupling factor transporter ATP-binding protein EcfA2
MHPKFLIPLSELNGVIHASNVLAVPIGGAGVYPLGIAKTFAQQFMGNKRANEVVGLAELLYAAGSETRLEMYFVALPEWALFKDNNYILDTPETTINFMLYYLLIIIFPNEEAEIVFKGVLGRILGDNTSMKEPRVVQSAGEEEEAPRGGPAFRKVVETPRIKVGKFGIPADVATQMMFTTLLDVKSAIEAVGTATNVEIDELTLADEIWVLLRNDLNINHVMNSLQTVQGMQYPPFTKDLRMFGSFHIPDGFITHRLIYAVPLVYGKDQLSLFMLPGIVNPTMQSRDSDDFDVALIGESKNSIYVSSETRGFSFKDPSKLLSPLPAICSKIFRRLLRLAESTLAWEHIYRYCHKYMRMLFSNPFVAGFPSIYRDLFTEIERLRVKKTGDKLMAAFYAPRILPKQQGVIHHAVEVIIALLHNAGLRDNHVVVALAYLSACGSCRIFGGDSDIVAFTGTAGKGKSNILNMISALVNEVSQYSMDASSARAITMPLNPINVGGRVVGEAPQNGRICFTDDGGGAFQASKGSHADKDGDAMALTAASRGVVSYQVITPHEDDRGNKINKVQTRVVACKSSRFMAMNGNAGSSAGASRMQCFYVKSSTVLPGNSASAVCPLDVNGVPDELESMYAANQLRNAEVSFYNALIAFGLANDATVLFWQLLILRALESPTAGRDYPEEIKILSNPRKIGSLVRNSLNLANNKLFHLLYTCRFAETFLSNTFTRYMWMQQANYISTELVVLALSSALPICNGASNIVEAIYRNIKDLIDFDVMAPFKPRRNRKGGKAYYTLRNDVKTQASLLQIIHDHMPDYEPTDVASKLSEICKSSIPNSRQQYLEKEGDQLIFYAKPLDGIFGCVELNVLSIMQAQFERLRKQHPTLHDCFPHDDTDEYILIPSDQTNIFSRHANNQQIDELGNEFEMGMSLLQFNISCGCALVLNKTQTVHPRDSVPNPLLPHHFPGLPMLRDCTSVNIKALDAISAEPATGFLTLVPCFRNEICMIATGKQRAPDVPITIQMHALTECFTITNPHFKGIHKLPSLETSVVEKEFFGADDKYIQIPPGPITELYLIYTRSFVLNRQAPMRISRPDFIAHFLKFGNVDAYKTYYPSPPEEDPSVDAVSIYKLFKRLAMKMISAGLDDEILRHLVRATQKRGGEEEGGGGEEGGDEGVEKRR